MSNETRKKPQPVKLQPASFPNEEPVHARGQRYDRPWQKNTLTEDQLRRWREIDKNGHNYD